MQNKTNVMRILDSRKIEYKAHCYEDTGMVSGVDVANVLGEDPSQVFKTLVTRAASKLYYVFVVPVDSELDLKKAAKSVNEKNIEMIKQKELLPLTGYIHGGCSPIGMKKQFTTVVHKTAADYDNIYISAGKVGYQVELSPSDLQKVIQIIFDDIVK